MRVLPFWILVRLRWRSASASEWVDSAQVKVWRLNRALERQIW